MIADLSKLLAGLVFILIIPLNFAFASSSDYILSERVYLKLNKVYTLLEKSSYEKARQVAEDIKLPPQATRYEKAMLWQVQAQISALQGDSVKAVLLYEKCLKQGHLPVDQRQALRLNLAELLRQQKKYDQASEWYQLWYKKEKSPAPDALAMGGWLYWEKIELDQAEKLLRQALESNQKFQPDWAKLLVNIYFKQSEYRKAERLLKNLLSSNTGDVRLWKQLAILYYKLERKQDTLAVLQAAYHGGLLLAKDDYILLAQLYYEQGLVHQASRVILKNLSEYIESDNNLAKLFADTLYLAGDWEKAYAMMEQIAGQQMAGDCFRIGQAQYQNGAWKAAARTLRACLTHTKGDEAVKSKYLLGQSLYEARDWSGAVAAFSAIDHRAGKDAELSRQWLDHVLKVKKIAKN